MSEVTAAQKVALQQDQAKLSEQQKFRAKLERESAGFFGRVTTTLAALGQYVVELGGDDKLKTPDHFLRGKPAKPAKQEKAKGAGVKVENATKQEEAYEILKKKLGADALEDIGASDIPKMLADEIIKLNGNEDAPNSDFEDALGKVQEAMEEDKAEDKKETKPPEDKKSVGKDDETDESKDDTAAKADTE